MDIQDRYQALAKAIGVGAMGAAMEELELMARDHQTRWASSNWDLLEYVERGKTEALVQLRRDERRANAAKLAEDPRQDLPRRLDQVADQRRAIA